MSCYTIHGSPSVKVGTSQLFTSTYTHTCTHTYVSQDGKSALYVAAQEGHEDIVELLLKAKADLELKTKKVGDPEYNM